MNDDYIPKPEYDIIIKKVISLIFQDPYVWPCSLKILCKTVQIDAVLKNLIFSTTEHDAVALGMCVMINKEDCQNISCNIFLLSLFVWGFSSHSRIFQSF